MYLLETFMGSSGYLVSFYLVMEFCFADTKHRIDKCETF